MYKLQFEIFEDGECVYSYEAVQEKNIFSGSDLVTIQNTLKQHGWIVEKEHVFTRENFRIQLKSKRLSKILSVDVFLMYMLSFSESSELNCKL